MTARIHPASSPTLDLLWSSVHETPEDTVTAAMSLAKEISATNSAISMAVTKALIWRGKLQTRKFSILTLLWFEWIGTDVLSLSLLFKSHAVQWQICLPSSIVVISAFRTKIALDSPEDQHLLDSKAIHATGNSLDSKEGVLAFKEKRAPKFVGSIPRDLPTELYPWWAEKRVSRL